MPVKDNRGKLKVPCAKFQLNVTKHVTYFLLLLKDLVLSQLLKLKRKLQFRGPEFIMTALNRLKVNNPLYNDIYRLIVQILVQLLQVRHRISLLTSLHHLTLLQINQKMHLKMQMIVLVQILRYPSQIQKKLILTHQQIVIQKHWVL